MYYGSGLALINSPQVVFSHSWAQEQAVVIWGSGATACDCQKKRTQRVHEEKKKHLPPLITFAYSELEHYLGCLLVNWAIRVGFPRSQWIWAHGACISAHCSAYIKKKQTKNKKVLVIHLQ